MLSTRAGRSFVFLVLITGLSSFYSRDTSAQSWSLPSPWSAQDIGSPALAGSASSNQGSFTITAAGTDIGGQSDQFTFIYQQVSGDVDVIARVDSITAADPASKTGVMIRSSLAANAAHGSALVLASRGVAFQNRPQDGAATSQASARGTVPEWVRVVRVGSKITAYSSGSGGSWSQIGSATIAIGTTAYVGLATTSHNPSATTTATVSQVSVVPTSLPSPQKDIDIGSPVIAGSAAYRQGTYSVHAGGADIGSTSDQFNFVYQPVTGDVEVIARITSISGSRSAKSGVMIRETLTPDSRQASALASAGSGYAFERRPDTGAFTDNTAGPAGALPGWVRLVRTGPQIEAFYSADGKAWTSMGTDAIPMADAVYIGLATTSGRSNRATDAVLDNVSVTPLGSSSNQSPQVALTLPTDGSIFTAGKDIVVNAAASDADGTIAKVDFFSGATPLGSDTSAPYSVTWAAVPAGTYSLTAVAVDNDGASTTSSAINVRVDPAANQVPSVALTAPANGATFTAPATVSLAATASDPDGTIAKVEFYNGATLLNTDTTAPYAFTWSNVAAGTYVIKAVAYDNSGASGSSASATITVKAANQAPTVTLTAPASGATFTAPASITLSATAADSDGTIAKVEFYNGTTLLNSDTTAPYSFAWSSVAAGTYTLKAIAYDNSGASTSSATSTVTVSTVTSTPPTGVVFTASTDHATLVTRYELRIYASGADPKTATPLATSDLGKPTPDANNDITVDRATFFSGLAVGNYVAAVAAIGSGGSSISTGVTFIR